MSSKFNNALLPSSLFLLGLDHPLSLVDVERHVVSQTLFSIYLICTEKILRVAFFRIENAIAPDDCFICESLNISRILLFNWSHEAICACVNIIVWKRAYDPGVVIILSVLRKQLVCIELTCTSVAVLFLSEIATGLGPNSHRVSLLFYAGISLSVDLRTSSLIKGSIPSWRFRTAAGVI